MSEEEKGKAVVCDHFEPQAWRKTVCKNCFQHPDVHPAGSIQNGGEHASGGGHREEKRAGSAEKSESSTASLLKSKYEQLEKDKFKPKEVESHTLPRTKKASGLALITEKYDQLDRLAGKLDSPTKAAPPPTPPKTYKKDGGGLTKFKFGSVENVSSIVEPSEGKLGLKQKFGSMENISHGHDKQKETISFPLQKIKDKSSDTSTKPSKTEVKEASTSKSNQIGVNKTSVNKTPGKSEGKLNLNEKQGKSNFEKPELKSTEKDDDKGLSKVGLKSKFDLKSPTPDKNKPPDFKKAKEAATASKIDDSKPAFGKSKFEEKSEDKGDKKGFQKFELKSAQKDKEENKLTSLKDKLNKTSETKTKEDSKVSTILKNKQDTPSKTETSKLGEKKTPTLNFKDRLKSPENDNSSLSKLKDKLKSPTVDDNKQIPSWKDKLKSPSVDKDTTSDFKLKHDLKSPTSEKDKLPAFQLKAQLRSSKENDTGQKNHLLPKKSETDKKFEPKPKEKETEIKSGLSYLDNLKSKNTEKKSPQDLKQKTNVEDAKPTTNKVFDLKSGLKKTGDTTSRDKEPEKTESKIKVGFPGLKSKSENTTVDKDQGVKGRFGAKDDKPPGKVEPKFKVGKLDAKAENEEKNKTDSKYKFGNLKLKTPETTKEPDNSKTKSKWESKETDSPSIGKNKFELPSLKKVKSPEPEKEKVTVSKTETDKKDVKSQEKSISKNEEKENKQVGSDKISDKTEKEETISEKTPTKSVTSESVDLQKQTDDKKESSTQKSEDTSTTSTPDASDIRKTTFEAISSDREAVSSDACVPEITREKSPLHVDTQVFTNTRSKTAGVSDFDDKHFDSLDNASGFSKLDLVKRKSPSIEKDSKGVLVNGDISAEHNESKFEKDRQETEKKNEDSFNREIEKLKADLLNMTERCQNLETENEMLQTDLNKKGRDETALRKQRDEVENLIKGLRTQLKSLEDKCTHLETENINLMNDMKAKHDLNQNKPVTKETEELDERLTTKEKIMEDMMEENEQLKQEINELKVEMEEMYDSFRDQEAEEFREMQKELEFTAKNCRILQFKMRKLERRNEQLEQDKNQFEERLRKLQNSFQDRDAVSHIHSLEDELRMAKEVSVRLHDELDLMEDRRTKLEEENRHLTELLEQADRKQFRLELEVDKLRDKVVELRQELRSREGGPEGEEPRKLNCSEFLALHRGTI